MTEELDRQVALALGWELHPYNHRYSGEDKHFSIAFKCDGKYPDWQHEWFKPGEEFGEIAAAMPPGGGEYWHPSTNLQQAVDHLMKPLQEELDWDDEVPEEYIWQCVEEWANANHPHQGNTPDM